MERCQRLMMIEFTLNNIKIPSTTAQQKRIGHQGNRTYVYKSKKIMEAEKIFDDALRPFIPAEPLDGPLEVSITWQYGIKDKKRWGSYKTARPDLDNMHKIIADRMTKAGYWHDDSQISISRCIKKYGPNDEILINIKQIGEKENE